MKSQPKGYKKLLCDVEHLLHMEKVWGIKAINQIKIQINWKIGEKICKHVLREQDRAEYGQHLVKIISKDLNISPKLLSDSIRFYKAYPFSQHISSDLTWSHYRILITLSSPNSRKYYEVQTIMNRWSVRQLQQKISSQEYETIQNSGIAITSEHKSIPSKEDVFKEAYNLPFLQIEANHDEKTLENIIITNMDKFLLQLGYGFAFIGSQKRIVIDGQSHYIDLLFFHFLLSCYVIVELKIDRFRDEFVGQINKYLTYFSQHENLPYMRPPIGLILCKNRKTEEVYYALGGLEQKIFVAEYKLQLPTEKQITKEIKKIDVTQSVHLKIRQKKALAELKKHKVFSLEQYQKYTKVSRTTAKRDIKQLIDTSILTKYRKGRKFFYQINQLRLGEITSLFK